MYALAETVYPRECGGTSVSHAASVEGQGLSPRVRGNPCVDVRDFHCRRSIPASAGEPLRLMCVCLLA